MNVFTIGVMSTGFQALWLLGAIVVAVVLILLYLRTRLSAMLWLMFAVVVWPLLDRLLGIAWNLYLPSYAARTASTIEHITTLQVLISGLGSLLNVGLLIVAVLLLKRQLEARLPVAALSPYGARR